MNDELKQLIEDAAKLLGYKHVDDNIYIYDAGDFMRVFNPLDPERGDLMKVMEAAELDIDFDAEAVFLPTRFPHSQEGFEFRRSNYQSLVLAVLRAASAGRCLLTFEITRRRRRSPWIDWLGGRKGDDGNEARQRMQRMRRARVCMGLPRRLWRS